MKTMEMELVPISKKFIASGGYRARLADQTVVSYDDVIQETIQSRFLRIDSRALKTLVEDVLDTMIEGVLSDGKARRLGEYFMIQPEICGRFDSKNEQFDETKHRFVLRVRPLKKLRQKSGVVLYNRNAGPKVAIKSICSKSSPGFGEVVFGEDMILTGENLWQSACTDVVDVEYRAKDGLRTHARIPGMQCTVSKNGKQMAVPWDETVKVLLDANPEKTDPEKHAPIDVKVTVESHGGAAESRKQTHRIKAKVLYT